MNLEESFRTSTIVIACLRLAGATEIENTIKKHRSLDHGIDKAIEKRCLPEDTVQNLHIVSGGTGLMCAERSEILAGAQRQLLLATNWPELGWRVIISERTAVKLLQDEKMDLEQARKAGQIMYEAMKDGEQR